MYCLILIYTGRKGNCGCERPFKDKEIVFDFQCNLVNFRFLLSNHIFDMLKNLPHLLFRDCCSRTILILFLLPVYKGDMYMHFRTLELSSAFLAHLSTTYSTGAFRVVWCLFVRSASFVANNFFKHRLLPNCLADMDQTWRECSTLKKCSHN